MTKHSSSFQRNIICSAMRVFICLMLLRFGCSFSNIDLSTQTLNPSTTGFMITGNTAGDQLGNSVSTAGDINGDGYEDIIVGTGNNRAYVIYGVAKSSLSNIDLGSSTLNPLTTGFTITGNVGDQFGNSVSTAGDIDNDGYDDIIVGAPLNGGIFKGAVYVIYGQAKSAMSDIDLSSMTLNPLTTGFMITGSALSYFGWSVSSAGDIDSDGYDDIIIGAYFQNSAYVIYGGAKSAMSDIDLSSTTLIPASTGFKISGSDSLGLAVSTAGDINNDGYDDIIVGAPWKNSYQGAAYVIYGGSRSTRSNIALSSTALNPLTTGFMITGDATSDNLGYAVSTAGDIDNDGYDDIIVGASKKNSNQGAAYVIYGGEKTSMSDLDLSSTALNPLTTGFTITGKTVGDYFGYSVSTVGDFNKDGYDDVIIGASNSATGAAYVIYGGTKSTRSNTLLSSTSLDPTSTGFMISGNTANFACSVNRAGDIDHDGYNDIIVGSTDGTGTAYLIYTPTDSCPKNCNHCSASLCTECKSPYLMYQSQCLDSCPLATFKSTNKCKDCPSYCSACTSQVSCQSCFQGYVLSNSLCVESPSSQRAQEKATKVIWSVARGISSVVCVGRAVAPLAALVSKIVQNTRYLNLSVTSDLSEIYQTWETDLISWNVPSVFSNEDNFKASPYLFARYDTGSPFLVNFWPTLVNIGIGLTTFTICFVLQRLFEHEKYEGWAYSLVQQLIAGSFNFALVQAYSCLDDILFSLVLDAKTNPFNSFFSWASMISAVIFLVVGCLLVFFNFWIIKKYQSIKPAGIKNIEAFNERNKYWELFYSDFNDDDLWSQSFFATSIIRSALSSFIITVLYDYPLMQTSYLVIMDGAIILFLYFKTPFNTLRGTLAQYYYEILTLQVHFCTFILSLQDTFEKPSDTTRLIFSTAIIYLNTALIIGTVGFMFIEIYETIREKKEAHELRQRQSVPEDNQEIQNLTQTAGPLQPTETDDRKTIRDQISSTNNFHFFNEAHQSGDMTIFDLKMESSQSRESNFTLRELDIIPMRKRRLRRQHGNNSIIPINH